MTSILVEYRVRVVDVIELRYKETAVLFLNLITDRVRRYMKYCHFFVTSILVKHRVRVAVVI